MEDASNNTTLINTDISSIKDWAVDDRPREKLLAKGKGALTNAELLAIIIGSGNREESAVALVQRILKDCNNDLNELGMQSVEELMRYKGIGEAKAISIVAMLELGRRRKSTKTTERPRMNTSKDAYDMIAGDLLDLHHEEFWIILLNQGNRFIKKFQVSNGGSKSVIVDPRLIFKKAIDHHAAGIVLAHNHPSGHLHPSAQDLQLTRKLVEGGKLLEVKIHDHLIVTQKGYYSFVENGDM